MDEGCSQLDPSQGGSRNLRAVWSKDDGENCQPGGSEAKSRHNPAQRRTPPAVEDPPALLALSPALSPAASEPACPPGHKRQKDCCRRGAASLSQAPFCGFASSGFFPSLRASSGQVGPVQPGVEVFVDGVPRGASQVELRDLFEAAVPGVVVKVALMKQFAFIHLRDEAAAEHAIQKLNAHLLHCHHVVVEFSRPRPTHTVKTFVGNVSAACTSGELRVLFQEFGPVIECHIMKGAWG
ncbi:RNA-binding protein 14-like [Crotalus adamanteus]|uniref:RNA-binding protein 14-like n=1 Tax=Crotalus adamanteus TaxID=8729 RepID=A0AAW1BSQ9_CROAD